MTTEEFFKGEQYYPKLISIIINNDNKTETINSNEESLELLKNKYPYIISQEQKIDTPEEQQEILKIIINKIIYDIKEEDIYSECQHIFETRGLTLNTPEELYTKQTFLALINFLNQKANATKDNINDLRQKFKNDFFITSEFFEDQYNFLILIQIHLLLEKNKNKLNPILIFLSFYFNGQFNDCISKPTESFYADGYHFPKLISIIFNNGEPFKQSQNAHSNNKQAIQFFNSKVPDNIKLKENSFPKTILKTIITKILFNIDFDEIKNIYKSIFKIYKKKKKKKF